VPSGDPSQAGFSVDIVHNGPPGRTGPALAPSAANLPVPYVAFRVNGATIATTSPTRPANPVDGMVVLDRRLGCLIWWDATKKRWRRTGNGVAV
jgi:hypothetical protein